MVTKPPVARLPNLAATYQAARRPGRADPSLDEEVERH
jgi:hypothetical protein